MEPLALFICPWSPRHAGATVAGGVMLVGHTEGQFKDELAELHDGSISLFVTLPVFRQLVQSRELGRMLARCESVIGEHLAHLDGILAGLLSRAERHDGNLTSSLFKALVRVRVMPASEVRDGEIVEIIEQAQLFLTGSCSFALRFARQAELYRASHVLEASLRRLGTLAAEFAPARPADNAEHRYSSAVA